MDINDDSFFEAIAKSTMRIPGCYKRLTDEERIEILNECK